MLRLARDPALALIAALGPLVSLIVSFTDLDIGMQTAINAVAAAVVALITAAVVRSDQLVPAILGVAQAAAHYAVSTGLALTDVQQTAFLTVVSGVVAAFVRTQVDAPVDELGVRRAARHPGAAAA